MVENTVVAVTALEDAVIGAVSVLDRFPELRFGRVPSILLDVLVVLRFAGFDVDHESGFDVPDSIITVAHILEDELLLPGLVLIPYLNIRTVLLSV